jgi:hypothetical protein
VATTSLHLHRKQTAPVIDDNERVEERAPPVAYSIAEFCKAHRISEAFFYKLRKAGLGPREMALGTRRLISAEAAAEWRRERTEASIALPRAEIRPPKSKVAP